MLVPSTLTGVKVYHRGATVYREVALDAAGGRLPEEIEVAGLPLALADPTARFRVLSLEGDGEGAGADLVVTELRIGLHVAAKSELPPEPDREALKKVERAIAAKRDLFARLEREEARLATIQVPDRPAVEVGRPPPASPIAARLALEELAEQGVAARVEEERRLTDELEVLEEEKAELERRLALASSARTAEAHEITKSVTARLVQGDLPIRRAVLVLEYFVPGASWLPAYQCRLSRDGADAEIQLRALVCQRSGEDWRGVKIELSTASPMSWTELPELPSLRIGRAVAPQPKRGFRPPPLGAGSLFADYDRERMEAHARLPSRAPWSAPVLEVAPLERPRVAFAGSIAPAASGGVAYPAAAAEAAVYDEEVMIQADAEPEMARLREAPKRRPAREVAARDMAPVMAAPAPSRSAAKLAKRAAPAEPPPPEALEAFVYTSLRLAPPNEELHRSRLTAVDRRAAYLESLQRFPVEVPFDALMLVEQATASARAAANVPHPPLTADVRTSAARFDYAYAADAPVDVASDGAFHSIALGGRRSPSRMRYVVVPREDPGVFRIAELDNPLEAPMLPGPAELYVGGEYVLTTRIPSVGPRGSLELGLGVEQAIKCARNTRFLEKRSGSKVVATNELWHQVEITLANNLGRPVDVEVRERIPQPAEDAEVVVEEGQVAPAWEAYEQAERSRKIEGGRRWRVTVAPHAEQKLAAEYVVKIYANNEVVGGNRRES